MRQHFGHRVDRGVAIEREEVAEHDAVSGVHRGHELGNHPNEREREQAEAGERQRRGGAGATALAGAAAD